MWATATPAAETSAAETTAAQPGQRKPWSSNVETGNLGGNNVGFGNWAQHKGFEPWHETWLWGTTAHDIGFNHRQQPVGIGGLTRAPKYRLRELGKHNIGFFNSGNNNVGFSLGLINFGFSNSGDPTRVLELGRGNTGFGTRLTTNGFFNWVTTTWLGHRCTTWARDSA